MEQDQIYQDKETSKNGVANSDNLPREQEEFPTVVQIAVEQVEDEKSDEKSQEMGGVSAVVNQQAAEGEENREEVD